MQIGSENVLQASNSEHYYLQYDECYQPDSWFALAQTEWKKIVSTRSKNWKY